MIKLSVSEVIVSQKGSNGDGKLFMLDMKEHSVIQPWWLGGRALAS